MSEATADTALRGERTLYLRMTLLCLGIAVLGFAPTYWRGLASGSFRGGPVVHLHAAIFYAWMVFFCVQSALAVQGRLARHRALGGLARHRALGLAGIALATLLVVSGMAVSISGGIRAEAAGFGQQARAFLIVSWSSMAVFALLLALAIGQVARPEAHRRFMMAATISMLGAPIARWFLLALAPETINAGGVAAPPPVIVSLPPALLGDLLFVPMLLHDRRTLGRLHPATVRAAALVVGVHVLCVPVSATAVWDGIAGWVLMLAR